MRVPLLPFFAPYRQAAGHTGRRVFLPHALLLAVLLAVSPARAASSDAVPTAPPLPDAPAPSPELPAASVSEGGLTLKPYLFILPDPEGTLTPDEAARIPLPAEQDDLTHEAAGTDVSGAQTFLPWTPTLTGRPAGSMWLRFAVDDTDGTPPDRAASPASGVPIQAFWQNDQVVLDLGDQTPGTPRVWVISPHPSPAAQARPEQDIALADAPFLHEVRRDREGVHPLPPLGKGDEVIIRLDGLPGLWFTPVLRTLPDAVHAPERRLHPLALAALTSLLLLCVVRSMTECGEGRIWAAVFAGAGLLHALGGVPATPSGAVAVADMPGVLAAGIALMILPHLGRNIMHTRELAPATDVTLLMLALPGAALALLPLLPGQAWTARLLALWPMGAALCLLPSLLLLVCGTPGSGVFFLACLGMTASCAGALWGAASPAAPLWSMAPLAGLIFAVLLMAAAPRAAYRMEPVFSRKTGNTFRRLPPADSLSRPLRTGRNLPAPAPFPTAENTEKDDRRMEDARLVRLAVRMEEALRSPLDALLREACSLDQVLDPDRLSASSAEPGASLPDAARLARTHADNMVAASRELSALITDIPRAALRAAPPPVARVAFDVRRLVRDAFDAVHEQAEHKGVGLSWYLAPHMGLVYRGDRDRLRFILSLLLEDAVRATDHGVVSLRVRRGASSVNPGHLRFSVADTGAGAPPLRRSSLMLARAWELAASHHGELTVQGSPEGVEISFSLECEALTDDGTAVIARPPSVTEMPDRQAKPAERRADVVIVASDVPLNRQLLAFYLRNGGYDSEYERQGMARSAGVSSEGRPAPVPALVKDVWEARSAGEAAALYSHTPTGLVVFDGHLPEDDVVAAIAAIRVLEGEHALPAVAFLAVAADEAQAGRLRQAGCDQTLLFPTSGSRLRAAAHSLAGRDMPPRFTPLRRTPPSTLKPEPAAFTEHRQVMPAEVSSSTRPLSEPVQTSTPAEAILPSLDPSASSPQNRSETSRDPQAAPDAGKPWQPPKKRFHWLTSLLKPTPRIKPEEEAPVLPAHGEWVGEPMPITPLAGPDHKDARTEEDAKHAGEVAMAESAREVAHDTVEDNASPEAAGDAAASSGPAFGQEDPGDDHAAPAPSASSSPLQDKTAEHAVRVAAMTFVLPDPEPAAENIPDRADEDVTRPQTGFPLTETPPTPMPPADGGDTPEKTASETPPTGSEPPETAGDTPDAEAATDSAGEETPSEVSEPAPVVTVVTATAVAPVQEEPAEETEEADSAPAEPGDAVQAEVEPERPTRPDPVPTPDLAGEDAPQRSPRSERRKSRLENMPFLSLDPDYVPPEAEESEEEDAEDAENGLSSRMAADGPAPYAPDEEAADKAISLSAGVETIVELTEADMVDSPLLRQLPDLVHSLDTALEQARNALAEHDARGIARAAGRMAEKAGAFGLYGMSDLALCLKQAAEEEDFDAVAQLVPDVEAEVNRHRGMEVRAY